jgi:uncharacterized membrane protein
MGVFFTPLIKFNLVINMGELEDVMGLFGTSGFGMSVLAVIVFLILIYWATRVPAKTSDEEKTQEETKEGEEDEEIDTEKIENRLIKDILKMDIERAEEIYELLKTKYDEGDVEQDSVLQHYTQLKQIELMNKLLNRKGG